MVIHNKESKLDISYKQLNIEDFCLKNKVKFNLIIMGYGENKKSIIDKYDNLNLVLIIVENFC